MTQSPLTTSVILTDNCSSRCGQEITRITPHYMAWYTDGETCAQSFVPAARAASANYCIGKDGDIVLNVPEEFRAWTSSSAYNDRKAITIECANYNDATQDHMYGELPKKTWDSLVLLCADICTRYEFRLNYTGDDNGNLTKHCWYGSTDCPGPWFTNQFDRLAREVNELLDGKNEDGFMTFIFRPDNAQYLVLYDGGRCIRIRDQKASDALQIAHKACTGREIPMLELNDNLGMSLINTCGGIS